MEYSKRDIKTADALALILTGLGILLLVVGVLSIISSIGGESPVVDNAAKAKAASYFWQMPGLRFSVLGLVFLSLGIALNLKLKRLMASGGKESPDYEGVP